MLQQRQTMLVKLEQPIPNKLANNNKTIKRTLRTMEMYSNVENGKKIYRIRMERDDSKKQATTLGNAVERRRTKMTPWAHFNAPGPE